MCARNEKEVVDVPKPFFLSVGAIKERKNTMRIVMAFSKLVEKGLPHHLVLVGKTGNEYSERVIKFTKENNLADRVHFLGHASHPQLAYLYKEATAFVFPSAIESFGFPTLEAASCGLPVITSNTGGVSEVMKEGGFLVDYKNVEDIAKAMYEVATIEEVRELLIAKGRARSEHFSWEKAGREFLALIDSLK